METDWPDNVPVREEHEYGIHMEEVRSVIKQMTYNEASVTSIVGAYIR